MIIFESLKLLEGRHWRHLGACGGAQQWLGWAAGGSLLIYPLCAVLQEEVRQAVTPAEPVQYYFTLAQQPAAVQVQGQQQGQQTTTSTTTIQPGQIIIAQPQQGQVSVGRARGCALCWGPLAHCSVLFSLLPAVP